MIDAIISSGREPWLLPTEWKVPSSKDLHYIRALPFNDLLKFTDTIYLIGDVLFKYGKGALRSLCV
jgi:hypothetical protein